MGKMWLFLSIVCAALIWLGDISESFPVEFLETLKFEELIKIRKYRHRQRVYEPFFLMLISFKLVVLAIITEYGKNL